MNTQKRQRAHNDVEVLSNQKAERMQAITHVIRWFSHLCRILSY